MSTHQVDTLWAKAVDSVKAGVGHPAWEAWFPTLQPEEIDENGTFHFSIATSFLRNWISTHYSALLVESLREKSKRIKAIAIHTRPCSNPKQPLPPEDPDQTRGTQATSSKAARRQKLPFAFPIAIPANHKAVDHETSAADQPSRAPKAADDRADLPELRDRFSRHNLLPSKHDELPPTAGLIQLLLAREILSATGAETARTLQQELTAAFGVPPARMVLLRACAHAGLIRLVDGLIPAVTSTLPKPHASILATTAFFGDSTKVGFEDVRSGARTRDVLRVRHIACLVAHRVTRGGRGTRTQNSLALIADFTPHLLCRLGPGQALANSRGAAPASEFHLRGPSARHLNRDHSEGSASLSSSPCSAAHAPAASTATGEAVGSTPK
ncbi:DnaA N-terminal domain-containing protein [Amorphus sp. 3PC139-8]|uniref:DnaA N-terminal domain-containing protein n=1 Tax=Amorphus sp. 3PC139-8 TaxID=2735676 RepID=UPI00345D296E